MYQFNYVLRCPGCDSKLHNMWWHQLPTQESCGYFVCNTCIEFLKRIVKGRWEKFASKRGYRQFPLLRWRKSYYITRAILYKNNHFSAGKVFSNYFPTNITVNQDPFDDTSVVRSDDVMSVSTSGDDEDTTTVACTSADSESVVPHSDSASVITSDAHGDMLPDSSDDLLVNDTSRDPPTCITPDRDVTSGAPAADVTSIHPVAVNASVVPLINERVLPPVPLFCDRGHSANRARHPPGARARLLQIQKQPLRPRRHKRKRNATLQDQIQVIQTSVHKNQRLLIKILEQLQKQS